MGIIHFLGSVIGGILGLVFGLIGLVLGLVAGGVGLVVGLVCLIGVGIILAPIILLIALLF